MIREFFQKLQRILSNIKKVSKIKYQLLINKKDFESDSTLNKEVQSIIHSMNENSIVIIVYKCI